MSSVKLSSSGGGSVSLSAASTSTDVTIKFPSGNSSAGQALVAGNTSGELDWETVPNSTAVPLLRLKVYNTQASANYLGSLDTAITWQVSQQAGSNSEYETDTHSAWDATNYWYVVPQAGFYRVTQHFLVQSQTFADTTKLHRITSGIVRADASNKTAWDGTVFQKMWSRHPQDSVLTGYEHTAILECAVGDAIKTSFVWDKGTDTNNTTTSVGLQYNSIPNSLTSQCLSIEFVRPS